MADCRKDRIIMSLLMLMMFGGFFVGETQAKSLEEHGMIFVKGGCYQMGDIFGRGSPDQTPVHEVCLDDFYMGKYEVTVGEFRTFIDETGYKTGTEKKGGCRHPKKDIGVRRPDRTWSSPGLSQTERHPVVCINWNDAGAYIKWKNKKTKLAFRLPTEAEWEYAARSGGKKEKWAGTSERSELEKYAWLRSTGTHEVGTKHSNGLGLYDMSGNVEEWVEDWYGAKFYKKSPKNNPILNSPISNPEMGTCKILRGGPWNLSRSFSRTTHRTCVGPKYSFAGSGFRLSHSMPPR